MSMQYPFLDLAKINAPFEAELQEAALRVISSGRYIGGDEVAAFERKLEQITGAKEAVGVSNGLDALHLVLEGYKRLGRLNDGDGVAVASNTYIASILAILQAGLRPVLVDPDPTTMNLSSKGLESVDRQSVKAIMPVHLYGRVAWDDEMHAMARENGWIVVEDVAQAIGARFTDRNGNAAMAGNLGDAGCFSFYPTKNVGALGDAGAVTTNDTELARAVRSLANYGSDTRYHNIYIGANCRLDPIQAAMLMVKLEKLEEISDERRRRAKAYDEWIDNNAVVKPTIPDDASSHVWHQYVVRIADGRRDEFRKHLSDNGVGTDVHYPTPPHRQPCLDGMDLGEFPIADSLASEVVSLPISHTSIADIREISLIINRF
ncbi:MAG: DegT/DnrJ/EryC1/StrS family aminotransferase [Bacteroides sp.]|nr:DegT/DnrJ/EryC1/StrS family aminotransferase [Bacteroides sp.]MCM1414260.1 DegT/DnrJ/EryC1/StrS family aminotransferase [Bacteroides sp.]MCM1472404.1 DegT/DnrJ/EryC1/StrS family aminotransferase [Bacteroides sp.]